MMEKQKKIELLQKIAHRLNEAHVQWALGASMLLYFKGITSEFHDIDLLVSEHDAECVRRILSEMGELCPPDPMPNPMYRTKAFMEFLIDSIEVDVMAGFVIVHEGTVYDCSLRRGENAAWNRSHPAAIAAVMVQILSPDGTASKSRHDREGFVMRHPISAALAKGIMI